MVTQWAYYPTTPTRSPARRRRGPTDQARQDHAVGRSGQDAAHRIAVYDQLPDSVFKSPELPQGNRDVGAVNRPCCARHHRALASPPRSPARACSRATSLSRRRLLQARSRGGADKLRVDSIIHPVASSTYATASPSKASRAAAVVIELDTPGGLMDSTREITTDAGRPARRSWSTSPPGAQAASAGFFILMAADVAAMAPGTNTGAAHPVGGQASIEERWKKVEQDVGRIIRSHRAGATSATSSWRKAVVKSRSFTADEALEGAADRPARAALPSCSPRSTAAPSPSDADVLRTAPPCAVVDMSLRQRAGDARQSQRRLSAPLGMLGLYFERGHPARCCRAWSGVCLMLAFYALSVLPVSYAGVALLLPRPLLFLLEIKVTSYGCSSAAAASARWSSADQCSS